MQRVLIDRLGQRYGKLVVVGRAPNTGSKGQVAVWICRCDCGSTARVSAGNLSSGASKSCGCSRTKHGQWKSRAYASWRAMWHRCTNSDCAVYHNYGGRGIAVDPDWKDFANFLRDMGERPQGLTLERVDNDKGYSKANCIWTTPEMQGANTRTVRLNEQTVREIRAAEGKQEDIALRFGVSPTTVWRVKNRQAWKWVS